MKYLKDFLTLLSLIILFVIVIFGLSFPFKENIWNEKETTFKKLEPNIIIAESKPLTEKEWRDLIEKTINKTILKYNEETNKTIKDIMQMNLKITQNIIKQSNADIKKEWFSKKTNEQKKYELKWLWTSPDDNNNSICLGYAKFDESNEQGHWTVGILPFKIKANIARLKADSGEYTYSVETVLIGPQNGPKEQRGKEWKIKLAKEDITVSISPDQKELPENELEILPKWHWWAPHIQANIGGGLYNDIYNGLRGIGSFGISFSPFGYGISKNDLNWQFLSVGIDYLAGIESLGISLTPVSWRPFNSFITNTRWQIIHFDYNPIYNGYYLATGISIDF